MSNNCHICPFLVGQTAADQNVIVQTECWVAVLDRNQSYLGKSFVTLRQHKATLSDLDDADWRELHEVIRQMEYAVKTAFGADVCNWECLMNNAVMNGEPTHVHWHLYPRYRGGRASLERSFLMKNGRVTPRGSSIQCLTRCLLKLPAPYANS